MERKGFLHWPFPVVFFRTRYYGKGVKLGGKGTKENYGNYVLLRTPKKCITTSTNTSIKLTN